ncbi:MAG TPA: Holliday junction resolvase Hjc [Acidobacteriota bacterium]|nr:Holliday junction resolvase Hjc [Acidobacteriota bacterium]
MSLKAKGIRAERELVHLLQARGCAAIRIAGSGCTQEPSADILAGNSVRQFAIECKSVAGDSRYITQEAVNDFLMFARQFGAEPWIAVRFARKPWRFLLCEDLHQTPKSYAVTIELAESKGLLLDELIPSIPTSKPSIQPLAHPLTTKPVVATARDETI